MLLNNCFFLCAAWRGGADQLPEGDVQPHLSGLHIYSSTKTNNGRRYAESSIRSSYRYEFVMALLWHPSIGWALFIYLSEPYVSVECYGACLDLVLCSRLSGVFVSLLSMTLFISMGDVLHFYRTGIIIHSLDISLALSWGLVHRISPHRPLLIEKASSHRKGLSSNKLAGALRLCASRRQLQRRHWNTRGCTHGWRCRRERLSRGGWTTRGGWKGWSGVFATVREPEYKATHGPSAGASAGVGWWGKCAEGALLY